MAMALLRDWKQMQDTNSKQKLQRGKRNMKMKTREDDYNVLERKVTQIVEDQLTF
jgi:hypothetical protein